MLMMTIMANKIHVAAATVLSIPRYIEHTVHTCPCRERKTRSTFVVARARGLLILSSFSI